MINNLVEKEFLNSGLTHEEFSLKKGKGRWWYFNLAKKEDLSIKKKEEAKQFNSMIEPEEWLDQNFFVIYPHIWYLNSTMKKAIIHKQLYCLYTAENNTIIEENDFKLILMKFYKREDVVKKVENNQQKIRKEIMQLKAKKKSFTKITNIINSKYKTNFTISYFQKKYQKD